MTSNGEQTEKARANLAEFTEGGNEMNVKPVMKPDESDPGGVSSIMFYPAERVREIFKRMKAARGTAGEAEEYRIFALRMERLYDRYSLESNTWLEDKDALRWAAWGGGRGGRGICPENNGGIA
jgi:hypothetical protein